MRNNIIVAEFCGSKVVKTQALYQWDYGQVLRFKGLDLPEAYAVHFSNERVNGTAITQIGNTDGVDIPDECLTSGQTVYAWVFLHTGADDGETVCEVIIPVAPRSKSVEGPPTPVQQGVVDQAIAALNEGVSIVKAVTSNYVIAVECTTNYLLIDNMPEAAKRSYAIVVDDDGYLDIMQAMTA